MSQERLLPKAWVVSYSLAGGSPVTLIWPFSSEPTRREMAALIRNALPAEDYTFPDLAQAVDRLEAAEAFLKLNAFENVHALPRW